MSLSGVGQTEDLDAEAEAQTGGKGDTAGDRINPLSSKDDDGGSGASLSTIPTKRFGDYHLVGKLGHGGMAKILLAYAEGPGGARKLVVVKRLHRHLARSEDHVKMFLDEARLAARMNHPNVVQTYELGEIDGSYFMAMEYLEGQSYDRLWRIASGSGQPLDFPLVARILVDALEGLHYAHELVDFDGSSIGMIHRDISPQNIFVTYEGTIKLLDFGVAKASTQDTTTESGVLKGKTSYVAPEQAHGQPLDRRVDIWGMGVVLWESLVGRRLFKSTSDAATLIDVLTAPIPVVRTLRPAVPQVLSDVAARALQRNRDRRYSTADEMRADIAAFLAEQGDGGSREALSVHVRAVFERNIEKHRRVVEHCLASAALAADLSEGGVRPKKVKGPAKLPEDPPEEETDLHETGERSADGDGHPRDRDGEGRQRRSDDEEEPRFRRAAGALLPLLIVVVLGISAALLLQPRGGRVDAPGGGGPAGAGLAALGGGADGGQPSLPVGDLDSGQSSAFDETLDGGGEGFPCETCPEDGGPVGAMSGEWDGAAPVTSLEAGERDSADVGTPPASGDRPRTVPRSRPRSRPTSRSPVERDATPPPGGEGGAPMGDASVTGSAQSPAEPAPVPPPEPGFLNLDTMPWTTVRLGSRRLGDTPLMRVPLPPGVHTLTLVNAEQGIRTTITVEISSGATTSRRLAVR